MEEPVSPSADDPQTQQLSRPEPIKDNDVNLSLQLARLVTHDPKETYVVQFRRDQIYRVPPPENARLVENYSQAAAPAKKGKTINLILLIWVAVVLLVISALIGIGLLVLYRSYTLKAPVFSVSKLHVQKSTSHPPKFDVSLKVTNPNEKMGIKYGSVVDAADLIFWTKKIGTGQFSSFYQEARASNQLVQVKIDSYQDQPVPHNIQKSMNDKKPTHEISLVLKFNSPLLLNVWIFKLWSKNMDVECHFRVNTLGQGTKVLSQNCTTTLS